MEKTIKKEPLIIWYSLILLMSLSIEFLSFFPNYK